MHKKIIAIGCLGILCLGYLIYKHPWAPGIGGTASNVEAVAASSVLQNPNHLEILQNLLFSVSSLGEAQQQLNVIVASKDLRFVSGLIDILRYRPGLSEEIGYALNQLTGQNLGPEWGEWVEWAGKHSDIKSFAAYPAWKAGIFEKIDPNFKRFVHSNMVIAPDSRVEEIVWGGVLVDGIPALDNPKMVDPREADYLVPDERIFGVSINGDIRAYPARFLDWHEMFNDVIGGQPVTLAY